MVISVFAVYLAAGIVYEAGGPRDISMDDFILSQSIWCYLAFYAVTVFVKGSIKSRAYESVKYGHENAHWKVWQCILAAAAAFAAAAAISAVIRMCGLDEIFTTYSTSADSTFAGKPPVLIVLTTVVLGPIAEELIFRYMTFGRMRCYAGRKWAVILSALLFGFYHVNLLQFIYCTLLGIVFAVIYDRSGNLWITIGAHMAVNMASVVAYF